MGQWLKNEGYQVLPVVIRQALALAGYDDLDRTATVSTIDQKWTSLGSHHRTCYTDIWVAIPPSGHPGLLLQPRHS